MIIAKFVLFNIIKWNLYEYFIAMVFKPVGSAILILTLRIKRLIT